MMGTNATVSVLGETPDRLVHEAFELLHQLHQEWSRFEESSDISRINNANGAPVFISSHTMHLLKCMQIANESTCGWFNPTLLPLQHQLGDNQSLSSSHISRIAPQARPYRSLEEIEFLDEQRIRIPSDMALDAGGIGKGLASDLTTQMLMAKGAASVSVNIGGDIRVACTPDFEHDWNIEVLDTQKSLLNTISLRNGAIATSSSIARKNSSAELATHILKNEVHQDERPRSASVIASDAMWAEVWTKYVMLAPDPFQRLEDLGLAAILVIDGLEPQYSSNWKEFIS